MRASVFRRPALVVTALATFSAPALLTASSVAAVGAAPDGSGFGVVLAISCPAAGNCAAVGTMSPPVMNMIFVVNETRGTWRRIQEVRGLARLPGGGAMQGELRSVSCSSPGNCSAGGFYLDQSGAARPFVVSERNGTWGNAEQVPGIAVLNTGATLDGAGVGSMSCWSAGNCGAGGIYTDADQREQAFVVGEKNGVWGKAIEIPGTAALNNGISFVIADVRVSCGAPGDCGAGGVYTSTKGQEAFVVTEKHGVWGKAEEVPGSAAVNVGGLGGIDDVSCPSAGTCTAVGAYADAGHHAHAFAVAEKKGRWGRLMQIHGPSSSGGDPLTSVSCASAGDCTAAGDFLVTEKNGVWGKSEKIPGAAALRTHMISVDALSCASAGNCGAGGSYSDQVFVISQKNGVWSKAEEVPGSAALNRTGSDALIALSCGRPGNCSAGGFYQVPSFKPTLTEPFVVSENRGHWGKAKEVPGLP